MINTALDILMALIGLALLFALIGSYLDTLIRLYQAFLDWLASHTFSFLRPLLMIIFIILDIALIIFIIITIRRYILLHTIFPTTSPSTLPISPAAQIRSDWVGIQNLLTTQNPSDWNMAVLRADALLDDVLRDSGYDGATLADRLKIVDPTRLPSLDRLWSAHRLRNAIAHDPTEQHTKETIAHALRSYERGLQELGILEQTVVSEEPSTTTAPPPDELPM